MKPEFKETLLLRMFSSIEYMEEYSQHFIAFIDTGLFALTQYEALAVKPVNHPNYYMVETDVRLWNLKVKPNFIGMRENIIEAVDNARQGKFPTIRSAAGNFRGLSRDMDGIREAFMDFIDPAIKQRYFDEWKITSTMGTNIYLTLSNYWRPTELLDTDITGKIAEDDLLKYLQHGEQP